MANSSLSKAECANSIEASCAVYSECFGKHCNCSGTEDEYLVGFGKSYCEAFLNQDEFSDTGKKWKESTLRCLQEALVPIIPFDSGKVCDCSKVKIFAYSSHVGCYTKSNNSVCDLPISDIAVIAKTIIFDKSFFSQVRIVDSGLESIVTFHIF